jgi:hypothetical protein
MNATIRHSVRARLDHNTAEESLPKRLLISIGGHFGTSFSVCLESGLLTYKWSKPVQNFPAKWDSRSEQIHPSDERWQAFQSRS